MSLFEGIIQDQYTLTYKRINSKKLQTWVHWPLHRAPAHKLHTLSSGYQGWLLSWAGWQRLQSCHWSLVEVSLHVKLQKGLKGVEKGGGARGCHLYVLGLHDDGAEVSAVLAGCAPTVLGGRRPARAGISRGRARLQLNNPSRSRSRATRATWG